MTTTNFPVPLLNVLRRIQRTEPEHTGKAVISGALEATLGQVPFIGGTLKDIMVDVIGPARIARVGEFCHQLASKVTPDQLDTASANPEAIEILEEGIAQAVRANSRERLEYLSQLVAEGLTENGVRQQRLRHFLRVLNQVDDAQVIILCSYQDEFQAIDRPETAAFFEKHAEVLGPFSREISEGNSDREKAAHKNALERHLSSFGLLEVAVEDLGTWDGAKSVGAHVEYRITPQGKEFLRFLRLAR